MYRLGGSSLPRFRARAAGSNFERCSDGTSVASSKEDGSSSSIDCAGAGAAASPDACRRHCSVQTRLIGFLEAWKRFKNAFVTSCSAIDTSRDVHTCTDEDRLDVRTSNKSINAAASEISHWPMLNSKSHCLMPQALLYFTFSHTVGLSLEILRSVNRIKGSFVHLYISFDWNSMILISPYMHQVAPYATRRYQGCAHKRRHLHPEQFDRPNEDGSFSPSKTHLSLLLARLGTRRCVVLRLLVHIVELLKELGWPYSF